MLYYVLYKISYDNKETNLQDINKYKLNKRLKRLEITSLCKKIHN